jgi:hypothetical protein
MDLASIVTPYAQRGAVFMLAGMNHFKKLGKQNDAIIAIRSICFLEF